MINLTNTYRRRIIKAALIRHHRKTGSPCIVINIPTGGIKTLELTEIVMDGLLCRFEKLARKEFGSANSDTSIQEIYRNAIDVNRFGEHLTESGKLLVDDLVKELVEHVKRQPSVIKEKVSD